MVRCVYICFPFLSCLGLKMFTYFYIVRFPCTSSRTFTRRQTVAARTNITGRRAMMVTSLGANAYNPHRFTTRFCSILSLRSRAALKKAPSLRLFTRDSTSFHFLGQLKKQDHTSAKKGVCAHLGWPLCNTTSLRWNLHDLSKCLNFLTNKSPNL